MEICFKGGTDDATAIEKSEAKEYWIFEQIFHGINEKNIIHLSTKNMSDIYKTNQNLLKICKCIMENNKTNIITTDYNITLGKERKNILHTVKGNVLLIII